MLGAQESQVLVIELLLCAIKSEDSEILRMESTFGNHVNGKKQNNTDVNAVELQLRLVFERFTYYF